MKISSSDSIQFANENIGTSKSENSSAKKTSWLRVVCVLMMIFSANAVQPTTISSFSIAMTTSLKGVSKVK